MSVECIVWALRDAPIPRDRRDAPSLALTLVGLANHASPDGTDAFPAVSTLMRYTRLSESTVRRALDTLHELGLITPSDPAVIVAKIKRADRRPQGWNLAVHKRYPQNDDRVSPRHPADQHGVSTPSDGVSTRTERGVTVTPETSLNRPENRPSRERAPKGARTAGMPPVCGRCDARESDPITARVIWLDADHTRSQRCPRCHPHATTGTVGGGQR
ncbi:helix-turn-helix domain-containing protein [Solihabitans fulvus]|uniref:helix-turn-helix domain-containing protein n=1 Tax=Solihabitans fulvus TaxID=1892852 RepID=UPI0016620BB8|nr:helix-turn-helix domain-containing protein [Solihabitans fulvus]